MCESIKQVFVVCPKNGDIKVYTDCINCDNIAQIKKVGQEVVVECLNNTNSIFTTSIGIQEAESLLI